MTAAGSWATLGRLRPRSGRLLVATPLLGDPNFRRAVVYLLEHETDGGTLGVVLNRPSGTGVGDVLPVWRDAMTGPPVVFSGGPVQPDGALCLGRRAIETAPSVALEALETVYDDGAGIRSVVDGVATVDLDGDVAMISARTRALRVFAGHAGWAPGQLAGELAEGAWWVVPGTPDDLFTADPAPLWSRVLRRQPFPLSLVSTYPEDPCQN